jgi:hypothetical protein
MFTTPKPDDLDLKFEHALHLRGDGNRAEKSDSKIYCHGGSRVLDETDLTVSVSNSSSSEYVCFIVSCIDRRHSSNNVFYYLAEQLDSSRAIEPEGHRAFCCDAYFEPFGGALLH